jgi:histidine ammonia-lyase
MPTEDMWGIRKRGDPFEHFMRRLPYPIQPRVNFAALLEDPVFSMAPETATTMDLSGFIERVLGGTLFVPAREELDRAARAYDYLKGFSAGKVIYGINTGFGPMAQRAVPAADRTALQYNLVRSHAAGAGDPFPDEVVRAMMLVRAITFLKGGSGVSLPVIEQLCAFLKKGICPIVPEKGGVGASGDLTQQAHLGLGLIGEGEGRYQGVRAPMKHILAQCGLKPVSLDLRDGLAILNGTACMTGLGLLNVHHAHQLVEQAIAMSALLTEVMGTWNDHLSAALNEAKLHPGQREVAARMRQALDGSKRMRDRAHHLYRADDHTEDGTFDDRVQEHYSIRCVPQVLGPILETVQRAEEVLLRELHSVDDNPFTQPEEGVFHGGNFHGDQVALEMDTLRLAIVKLSMLVERQLNFLMNDRVNRRFPAFLNMERPGLTLGMQGMQFTATSTTAENQALATSLYIHSIPNNNDNQDVVSMGTNAASATERVLTNTARIMSIQAIALAQAVDIGQLREELSQSGVRFQDSVRSVCAPIDSASSPMTSIKAVEEKLFRPVAAWRK